MPVQTPHPQYTAHAPLWQRCRAVYAGQDAVKAESTTYLPKPGGMTDPEYEAYKLRAMFFNGLRPTVEGFEGMVFRQAPEVVFPDALAPHLDDITLDDTPFVDLAVRTFRELLVVSRAGILLDFSGARARPYWVPYSTEQILSWRVGRVRDGLGLTRVVLQETIEEPDPRDPWVPAKVQQIRVLLLEEVARDVWQYRVELYRQGRDAAGKLTDFVLQADTPQPTRRGAPLDFLPFVLVGPAGLSPDVADPVLLDLVNVNLSQYVNYADLEHGRHMTGGPTPVVTGVSDDGSTKLKIGSATAWLLPVGADAKFLEFKGEGLGALEKAVAEKRDLMAALGAKLLQGDPARDETAEAVRLRHSGEHARLRTIAESAGQAFSALLRWHVWWATAAGEVDADTAKASLTTEFVESKLSPEERKVLLLEWQSGAISHRTYYEALVRGNVARKGVTFEQEQKEIEAGEPDMGDDERVPALGEGEAA